MGGLIRGAKKVREKQIQNCRFSNLNNNGNINVGSNQINN